MTIEVRVRVWSGDVWREREVCIEYPDEVRVIDAGQASESDTTRQRILDAFAAISEDSKRPKK